MSEFPKDTYCSFCYMPGAKHEGGAEINGISVSGVFCNKACFDKWLRWKGALLSGTECPTCSKQEDRQPEAPMGDA